MTGPEKIDWRYVPTCAVAECTKPVWTRGWCNAHYIRWQRHGDPLGGGTTRTLKRPAVIAKCAVAGCDFIGTLRRGWCERHYRRWKVHGDPLGSHQSKLMAFVESATRHHGDKCLLWPFGANGHGYGQVRYKGSQTPAHRVVCELAHGRPPSPKHHAAHNNNGDMCISRLCVNPKHLRWATPLENESDKAIHGGIVRGERHGMAKLTEWDVRTIRGLKGKIGPTEIARMFSVGPDSIRNIHAGRSWAWLDTDGGHRGR